MIFVAHDKSGNRIEYRDTKRSLWLLSVFAPSLPFWAAVSLYVTGNAAWSILPVAFYFGLIPVLDILIGEDENNPPEEVVEQLSSDVYYRFLLFCAIPVLYASFIAALWVGFQNPTPYWAMICLAIGSGIAAGTGINIGHELGHKSGIADRWGAKIALALSAYGHFSIEHNRGHHLLVATPEDPASAKLGEDVYSFALREVPGTAVRGWKLEKERLAKKGLSFWHWRNDILQSYSLSLFIAAAAFYAFGWWVLPFLLTHYITAWSQLTFANYVEHYGLLRQKKPNGRHEACQPHHSWNTNHVVSNLMLFHLQRHSDHHANPFRPYQALRNFQELPRLPSGYPGSYLLAAIPPLWFKVMNPKVLALANGDLQQTNHLPGYKIAG